MARIELSVRLEGAKLGGTASNLRPIQEEGFFDPVFQEHNGVVQTEGLKRMMQGFLILQYRTGSIPGGQ